MSVEGADFGLTSALAGSGRKRGREVCVTHFTRKTSLNNAGLFRVLSSFLIKAKSEERTRPTAAAQPCGWDRLPPSDIVREDGCPTTCSTYFTPSCAILATAIHKQCVYLCAWRFPRPLNCPVPVREFIYSGELGNPVRGSI